MGHKHVHLVGGPRHGESIAVVESQLSLPLFVAKPSDDRKWLSEKTPEVVTALEPVLREHGYTAVRRIGPPDMVTGKYERACTLAPNADGDRWHIFTWKGWDS